MPIRELAFTSWRRAAGRTALALFAAANPKIGELVGARQQPAVRLD